MSYSFKPANILLPKDDIEYHTWSVVACDQYTSQLDYWKEVEKKVEGKPSTFNIVYPEVYLGESYDRTSKIKEHMNEYLDTVLEEKVHEGYVLVARVTESGNRLGLVGKLDLDNYDYAVGSKSSIRATEGTIESRIPPRQKIRRGATIELPHIMVLIDDPKCQLIEKLYDQREMYPVLYDFDLMMNGGHISGYKIEGTNASVVNYLIENMEDASNGFFLAMGDGNHSLATAKACWEEIKATLSIEEQENHPARYALVEIVNLHSPALIFEPIHRIIFNKDKDILVNAFKEYLNALNMELVEGNDLTFIGNNDESYEITNKNGRLPIDLLQSFLDEYLGGPEDLDYIHGENDLRSIRKETDTGILLGAIDKNGLFTAIDAGGVLPRKTFSMGEAHEKRFYLESRLLK